MAEELGQFTPYVGGAEHVHTLFRALEMLCNVEECTVREKAQQSLVNLAKEMRPDDVRTKFIPLIQRLASAEWATSRSSACNLLAAPYAVVPSEVKLQLLDLLSTLCSDDEPMVRRAACGNLKHILEAVGTDPATVKGSLYQCYLQLSKDNQDSVRLLAVSATIPLATILHKISVQTMDEFLLPVISSFIEDKAWRVRYMVAHSLPGIVEALGSDSAGADRLVEGFRKVLSDPEPEVKTAAAYKLTEFAKRADTRAIVRDLLPECSTLITDPSQNVRSAIASSLTSLPAILGRQVSESALIPLFLSLLKDTAPDVRLAVIGNLAEVTEIGLDLLRSHLVPALVTLAEDAQWRVRYAVIGHIPQLSVQLGQVFFEEKLSDLLIAWLKDRVFAIREAAVEALEKIVKNFGEAWATEALIPRILSGKSDRNYLYRTTTLYALRAIGLALTPQTIASHLIPAVLELSRDPVPNIRFVACKILADLIPSLDKPLVNSTIRPLLHRLHDDSDRDVQFYAAQALTKCGVPE
eukprot:NODE_688_length_1855_cov_6.260797_g559_i0.p1 GENE.NODE_688_length_1855_cov_6.260797_g559_i0~~NODE_688_length_1855_cov_6.260797_g559_i0.p1  ORF type:complete len:607 (+),score=144.44 NODE_688_length_1855_cov_6.260797_g559_i0:251-1822(+)